MFFLKSLSLIIDDEGTLCKQLLLHPPFKPKRLIHLCTDGSIQVLSAVDDNSDENQLIHNQQYHLNYSNSAITPKMEKNHVLASESIKYSFTKIFRR